MSQEPQPVTLVPPLAEQVKDLKLPEPQQPSLPPDTTSEQDLKSLGQRQINMLWERTQAAIALMIVGANIAWVFVQPFLPDRQVVPNGGVLLANAFFLIIGFYFSRTNHARIGDPGKNTGPLDTR